MSSGFKLPLKGVLVCVGKEPTKEIQRTINFLRKKNLKVDFFYKSEFVVFLRDIGNNAFITLDFCN